jgi:hypothetical protein
MISSLIRAIIFSNAVQSVIGGFKQSLFVQSDLDNRTFKTLVAVTEYGKAVFYNGIITDIQYSRSLTRDYDTLTAKLYFAYSVTQTEHMEPAAVLNFGTPNGYSYWWYVDINQIKEIL